MFGRYPSFYFENAITQVLAGRRLVKNERMGYRYADGWIDKWYLGI